VLPLADVLPLAGELPLGEDVPLGGELPLEAGLQGLEGGGYQDQLEALPAEAHDQEPYAGYEQGQELPAEQQDLGYGDEAAGYAAQPLQGADGYGDGYAADPYGQPAAAQYAEHNPYGAQDGYAAQDQAAAYGAEAEHGPAERGPTAADEAYAEQRVAKEREKHEAQSALESKAREELEDMILRIEKHFKAEQAARKKAEELLQNSVAAEMESRAKVEDVLKKRQQEQRLLEDERGAIKRERLALESMRQEFEAELQAARSEVAKAQEALAGSEERIRATEQVERARMETDYQGRMVHLQQDMDRMRDEYTYRLMMMNEEMEKWRQQAVQTSNAVLEAKNEVIERKKELDHTKDKMDQLIGKLYIGRERGVELSGAIASNQRMMNFMPGGMLHVAHPGVFGNGHPGMFGGHPGQLKQPPMQAWGPQGSLGNGGMFMSQGQNQVTKLPPLQQQPHIYEQSMGDGLDVRRVHSQGSLGQNNYQGQFQGHPGYAQQAGSYNDAGPGESNEAYGHVQSKFAQGAEEKGMQAKADRVARAKSGRNQKVKPDRFAEAERDAQRLGAMGKRWS